MSAKKILAIVISLVLVAGLVFYVVNDINSGRKAKEICASDAEVIVNEALQILLS